MNGNGNIKIYMKRYLLSTGASTTEIEKYVLDLFKLYIQIYPGDIPGSNIGFNFILRHFLLIFNLLLSLFYFI